MTPNYLQQQLAKSGRFSHDDLEKIRSYRGKHNQLGFGYQLIFVRLLNYFPKQSPFEIVEEVLLFAGVQLDIDVHHVEEYQKYQQHIARHQEYIRCYLGLTGFVKCCL